MKLKQIKFSIVTVFLFALLWFPTICFSVETDQRLRLTNLEKEWLAKHPSVLLGVDPSFEPYEFINKEGVYSGISADYIAIIADVLGLK